MDNTLLLGLVGVGGTVLGGGGIWAYITKRADLEAKREEGEIGRLREDVDELRERDRVCQEALDAVEKRLWAMEQAQNSHMARWTKDHHKRVSWVNAKAMLLIFGPLGYSIDQVIGRTFEELLDAGAAREIERLDASALVNPGAAVSNLIQLHPHLPVMVVVKVAATGAEGNLVFEGTAYRANDPEVVAGNGAARQREGVETSTAHLIDGDHGPVT